MTGEPDPEESPKNKPQDPAGPSRGCAVSDLWVKFSSMAERALTHVNKYNTRIHDCVANQQAPLGCAAGRPTKPLRPADPSQPPPPPSSYARATETDPSAQTGPARAKKSDKSAKCKAAGLRGPVLNHPTESEV